MKELGQITGTAIGVAMVGAFATGIGALVLGLASEQLPALKTIGSEIRCLVGVPAQGSTCVSDQINALDDQRRLIEQERDTLARQIAEYEARQHELEALNGQVENYSQFQDVTLPFGAVTTGIRFASVLEPEAWSEAWCYLDRTVRGLPRKITLGNRAAGEAVRWTRVSDAQLRDADLTRAQLEQAKAACQFPENL